MGGRCGKRSRDIPRKDRLLSLEGEAEAARFLVKPFTLGLGESGIGGRSSKVGVGGGVGACGTTSDDDLRAWWGRDPVRPDRVKAGSSPTLITPAPPRPHTCPARRETLRHPSPAPSSTSALSSRSSSSRGSSSVVSRVTGRPRGSFSLPRPERHLPEGGLSPVARPFTLLQKEDITSLYIPGTSIVVEVGWLASLPARSHAHTPARPHYTPQSGVLFLDTTVSHQHFTPSPPTPPFLSPTPLQSSPPPSVFSNFLQGAAGTCGYLLKESGPAGRDLKVVP